MEVIMQEHFEKIYQFYEEKEFCDVTLVTDEGLKIEAHRNILASASHVFYTMFSGQFKERNENEIFIKEIDSEILELVVKFAYTCKLDIKENNCEKLLMAANMYGLNHIKELCFKHIKENINPTICVSFMKTSKLISNEKIYNFCWSYFLNHFTTIVNSDQALETLYGYEFDDVVEFIARDDLVIDSEEKIFDFIIGWIHYNTDERNDLLPVLMKYLRLALISKEGLQRIYNEPLVRNNNDVMTGIVEYMINTYNNSKPSYTLGRCTQIESPNIVFAITGQSNNVSSCVKYMDIRNDNDLRWKSSDHSFFLPSRKGSKMVVSENGIILSIGGLNETGRRATLVDELDLKSESKQWVSTRPLNRPRIGFAVCTYKQYIYVVGGCDSLCIGFLNSVEYYNTNSKVWTEITEPMPTARSGCGAVVFNNKLYVFGGRNDNYLATVEYYDFEKKHWRQLDPMPICIVNMDVSRIENVVYLIGGFHTPRRVFKFDLHHFKWDEVPEMNGDCDGSSVGIMRNDLFVIGNNSGQLHCERYDRGKNQWQLVDRVNVSTHTSRIITFNDITLKSYGIQL
ncbi:kelch-like protein 2 [Adelges cooleyi]|uniref:kelch-like protein 2 n=1 Tax=Adelges cooleyi TaxID=133065 RepID=UPI0021800EA0|nr:kelch-like protein 2 [Adelges cooleyi]